MLGFINKNKKHIEEEKQFENFMTQGLVERISKNPENFANSLKESNVIDDEQYKQIIINIRKDKLESDFTNDV